MHGNPQPPARKKPTRAVFATYLFMKCEVMKKVLNPTTVLTLTVLSRSAGPGGAVPASTPGCPPPSGTAQSTARDFKRLLARGCSQGWEGKTRKNPLLQEGGMESCKVGSSPCQDSAQGSSRNEPLPDLHKVQQDGAFPNSRSPPPLQKSFLYIYKKQTLYQYFSKSGTKIQYKNTASSIRLAVTAAGSRTQKSKTSYCTKW